MNREKAVWRRGEFFRKERAETIGIKFSDSPVLQNHFLAPVHKTDDDNEHSRLLKENGSQTGESFLYQH